MRLLFHQTALGDFALVMPVLRAMVSQGDTAVVAPWSRIEVATTLVPGVRGMDIELFEFSRLHVPGGPSHLSPLVAKAFAAAEVIVSFISNGQDDWASNVRRLAPGAMLVCVPPRPPRDWGEHASLYHASLLDREGLHGLSDACPTVNFHRSDGPIVVHPGSGGVGKQWPLERFDALLDRLHESAPDRPIRVIAGDAEADRWEPETLTHWEQHHHLMIVRTATGMIDAMRDAAVYVGNDAGPTHVAAQAGLATVVLFGPTSPKVWAPVGPNVLSVAPNEPTSMDWLSVDRVAEAVLSQLG